MGASDNEVEEYRKDLGLRTDWASVLGEIVELSVVSKDMGLAAATKAFEDGWAEGRVTGVDASGVWFECTDYTFEVAEKKRELTNVPHFFIPFSNIRSVEFYPAPA